MCLITWFYGSSYPILLASTCSQFPQKLTPDNTHQPTSSNASWTSIISHIQGVQTLVTKLHAWPGPYTWNLTCQPHRFILGSSVSHCFSAGSNVDRCLQLFVDHVGHLSTGSSIREFTYVCGTIARGQVFYCWSCCSKLGQICADINGKVPKQGKMRERHVLTTVL